MTVGEALPDLHGLTVFDDRLRGVARDSDAVRNALARASVALAEARRTSDTGREQRLLGYLGNAYRLLGERDRAVANLRESLALAETLGDERAAVVALVRIGDAHRCAGEPEVGEPLLRDALARADTGAADLRHFALQHLGKALLDLGEDEAARASLGRR